MGGSAITSYVVTCTAPGRTTKTATVKRTVHTAKLTALVAGSTYTCTVVAINAAGTGPASSPFTFVADRLPGPPTAVVAARGDSQFTVTWAPPVANGSSAVTGYSLDCSYLSGGVKTAISIPGPIVSPITVTGATNGTTYTCLVSVHNVLGSSPAVKKTVVPSTTPGAPTAVTATAKATSATITWAPPSDNGGSAVTGYVVRCASSTTIRRRTSRPPPAPSP